jgi:hypothetical protein
MTLPALFAKEVYIRLAEDNTTFLCTVRRGLFRFRPTEVRVEERPVCLSAPDSEPCGAPVLNPKVRARPNRFFS